MQTNNNTKTVLFADDTGVSVNNPSLTNFERDINVVFTNMNEWFSVNLRSLNFGKTQFMHFITRNSSLNEINIEYKNKLIASTSNLKFLGIIIDNTMSWKNHIDVTAPKLSQTCYIVRTKLHHGVP
jgi:hypothetical protein